MAEAAESKRARVHLRVDARSKRTLERAAAYEDTTVSRFVVRNAVAAAERVIEARERIVLPATDWDAFHDALLHPPEPNAAPAASCPPLSRARPWMNHRLPSNRSAPITTVHPFPVGNLPWMATSAGKPPRTPGDGSRRSSLRQVKDQGRSSVTTR